VEKVRWGILGAAKIAREWIIPAIQTSSLGVVTALASRDAAKGKSEQQRFNISHLFSSYESLLASNEVDAVYLPTMSSSDSRQSTQSRMSPRASSALNAIASSPSARCAGSPACG